LDTATSITDGQAIDLLGEDPPLAAIVVAEEPTHLQAQHDFLPGGG
jgi:hypothetical protein